MIFNSYFSICYTECQILTTIFEGWVKGIYSTCYSIIFFMATKKMKKRNILLVKSSTLVKTDCQVIALQKILSANHWHVEVVSNISDANSLLKKSRFYIALVYVDSCGNQPFLEHLKCLFEYNPRTNWLMLLPSSMCIATAGQPSQEQKLIAEFCYDYLSLPLDKERLLITLGHAYGMSELTHIPYEDIASYPAFHEIIGESKVMHEVCKQIKKLTQETSSVLIGGETGTGKELIANAIHHKSDRAGHAMVAVNCGAIPKDLVQAELFGYEKGAFTGANQRKIGYIEAAQGGTLFLDEIGDLPLDQQRNLLRFLEQKTIERVGGVKKIPIDVRVISATNTDLEQAVQRGSFREDLYYRLKVLHLTAPPLRERDNDAELLAWYFFHKFSADHKHKSRGFSLNALNVIRHYQWPGNVRELSNCIMQAIVMSENRLLSVADLGLERRSAERNLTTLEKSRCYADKQTINACLIHHKYNMTQAAKQLGISRVTLYRLINKYQLLTESQTTTENTPG